MGKWHDVHFGLHGFLKIHAGDEASARVAAECILQDAIPRIEVVLKTGIGLEVTDVLEESALAFRIEATDPD